MVGVAMTNYPAPKCNGRSIAFDGMAYSRDEGSRDTLLVEAGPDEGMVLATFDLVALRAYRAYETWGNAYRRPRAYAPLVAEEVHPPFRRANARR
jgi:predicted amidohydrolase